MANIIYVEIEGPDGFVQISQLVGKSTEWKSKVIRLSGNDARRLANALQDVEANKPITLDCD